MKIKQGNNTPVALGDWMEGALLPLNNKKTAALFARLFEIQYRRGELTLDEIYDLLTGTSSGVPEDVEFIELPNLNPPDT